MSKSIYLKECYGLNEIPDNHIDAIITDPPYGINLEKWDVMPNKIIWNDCYRVLKPGGFLICFSSIQFLHLFTSQILEANFIFKDTLNWVFLNGRVPSINVDQQIDNHLGLDRPIIGEYKYQQGVPSSKKKQTYTNQETKIKTGPTEESAPWAGFGTGLKTAYEPILIVQKPLEGSLAENILKYGVGAFNLESTRIPYDEHESPVGHNPHPKGRVMANIIQTEEFGDYQKFFFVGKVRDGKKTGNTHPTVKPNNLMTQLVELVTKENMVILDPFMGSGSTGVAALELNRSFIGYEKEEKYFEIATNRLNNFNKS